MKPISYSKLTIAGIVLLVVALILNYGSVSNIGWDVFGYYLYLPGFLVFNDLGIDNVVWVQNLVDTYKNTSSLYQFSGSPTGHHVIQYTMGMAFLYTPFFILGHISAFLFDYPIDGLSLPYQIAFIVGNLFYMMVGLIYLRKTLLTFFSEKVVILTLLTIVLGTNYIHLYVWGVGNSHNYLFALYALLFWISIKWHEQTTIKNTIILAVVLGLIVLIRPSEIGCFFIPIFYGFKNFKERWGIIKEHQKKIILLIIVVLIIGLPQLIYWKMYSGQFLYVSYQNHGEGLDFFSPHLLDVLFSFRKGWLIYTPVMSFSIIGLYFLYKQHKKLFFPVILFFVFNLIIVSSWSVWWYAVSYSSRALMQSSAVMAIPLAAFLSFLFNSKAIVKWLGFSIIIFFIGLNGFQIWQYNHGIIDGSRMTKTYYFSVFGQTTPPTDEQKQLLLIERSLTAEDTFRNQEDYELTYTEKKTFETEGNFELENAHSGKKVFKLNAEHIYSPSIRISFKKLTNQDHAWIKISLWVYPPENWKESKLSLITHFDHKGAYKYRGINTEVSLNLIPNQWNKIEKLYLTPEVRNSNDEFVAFAWLRGNKEILIDDLKIEVYNKKRNK